MEKFSEEDDGPSPAQPSELRELGLPGQKSAGWNELGLKFTELDLNMRSPELEAYVRLIGEELLG